MAQLTYSTIILRAASQNMKAQNLSSSRLCKRMHVDSVDIKAYSYCTCPDLPFCAANGQANHTVQLPPLSLDWVSHFLQ